MTDFEFYINQPLLESSLSRVWQHINDPNRRFAIISAFLQTDDDQNNHKALSKDIRRMGYGYIELLSGYTYDDPKFGKGFAEEKSYLIPEISKRDAFTLAKKYGQESIIYKEADSFQIVSTTGKVYLDLKTQGNTMSFNRSDVENAFSSLKKGSRNQARRRFAFVAESRVKDFPTAGIYWSRKYPRSEFFKIIENPGVHIMDVKAKLISESAESLMKLMGVPPHLRGLN